ncbi:MAG TPA: sigma-70 family RNA polymerase sigma factor [Planctomycetota bacterium]
MGDETTSPASQHDGSRPPLDELLARHLPALRVFVRLQAGPALRQRESCSDLVQSTCLELVQGLDRVEWRGHDAFRAWLFAAALNKIRERDRYHHAARRDAGREVDDPREIEAAYGSLLSPSRVAMGHEKIAQLEAAFDQLSTDHREVIVWCRVVGLSQDEVAARMGRTVDSVRNLLLRALARLAALADRAAPPTRA